MFKGLSMKSFLNRILHSGIDDKHKELLVERQRDGMSKQRRHFYDRARAGQKKISKLARKMLRRRLDMKFWMDRGW